jgi:hypothetical protein
VRLEDLQPGASVRGILPDASVSVVSVQWHGSDALTLVYRGQWQWWTMHTVPQDPREDIPYVSDNYDDEGNLK